MKYITSIPIKLRTACSLNPAAKIRASDQVQSTVMIASAGAITPNCPSALRGPDSATGKKDAARTTPEIQHQAKWPAPMAAMSIGNPPRAQ
jgi:hypothetical protein